MITGQRIAINLTIVQLIRKAALLAAIVAGVGFLIVGESRWPSGTLVHEAIEWVGLILIVACIVGRVLCTLYIGGRKVAELVDGGPYSVSRNPLYALSVVGATGAGAQLGSISLALAAGAITWLIFLLVIFREEQALAVKFGDRYRAYTDRVPRLWPKFSLWRDQATVEVNPRLVLVTALDASVFMLSLPLAEGFEYLHNIGVLPTLLTLP